MADMTMRIEASPELERMLKRVAQEAVQDVRTGRGQEGRGLYPVTIQAPDGERALMVDEIGESHWVGLRYIQNGEARGWRQVFTLSPRPAPAPREVPDVMARARRARGGRGETDVPPGKFERAVEEADFLLEVFTRSPWPEPAPREMPPGRGVKHVHRASCHGAIGELLCGTDPA